MHILVDIADEEDLWFCHWEVVDVIGDCVGF